MSSEGADNLIDFSIEEDETQNPGTVNGLVPVAPIMGDLLPNLSPRISLGSNPFDSAQKEACLMDDPFEIVQKEAEQQSYSERCPNDVKTDNLLLMDDGNEQQFLSVPCPKFSRLQSTDSNRLSSVSSIEACQSPSIVDDSAFTSNNFSPLAQYSANSTNIRNESSLTINKAFMTDGTISTVSNTPENSESQLSQLDRGFIATQSSLLGLSCSQNSDKSTDKSTPVENQSGKKPKDPAEYRKRLLKLSLSNSTINSPANRRGSRTSEEGSPNMSAVFTEAENMAEHFFGMVSDAGKSPDDSCDDLMSIKPNWVDSETDIDSDLEMMNIPILKEIQSPIVEKSPVFFSPPVMEPPAKHSPDLDALREKVKLHKSGAGNASQDVSSLIESLKSIILEHSSEEKKKEANSLFESLNSILNDSDESKSKLSVAPPPVPQAIVRQGTFDIDLKDNEHDSESKEKEDEKHNQEQEEHHEEIYQEGEHQQDQVVDTEEQVLNAEEEGFESPERDGGQNGVNDIVEQLGRLLGNQNVNVVQANMATPGPNLNPTYIVVMNTPQMPNKSRLSMCNQDNDGSPELVHAQTRRRSQSLSLHDKSALLPAANKIDCARTPIRPPTARRNSFSTPMNSTPKSNLENARRSIYSFNKESAAVKPLPRRSMLGTHYERDQQPAPPKPSAVIKPEINTKKFKLKSSEGTIKSNGPLKATIPIKKVAPMIVTPSLSSPIQDSKKLKAVTSTPIVTLTSSKGFPNACSTPAPPAVSPARRQLPKSRYSYLSATPNPKLQASSTMNRRRSFNEIKSPRNELTKASSGISKPVIKSLKLPQNFSKTLNKLAPPKVMPKIQKPGPEKNKENKQPRLGV